MERLDERCPLDLLCEAIVDRFHASLRQALPRIRDDLTALSSMGASHEVNMMRLAFSGLADQIEAHLSREEHLLFPAFNALAASDRDGAPYPPLPFATVLHPIRMMEVEHARIEASMRFLRDLAREVPEPVSLMPAWRHCMASLADLDGALRDHHRTENEVLFPRALDIERRLL